jgi:hypothetical protein
MEFLRKYYSQLIAAILGILVGFFIALFSRSYFDEKINPVALASLLLTIGIALYLEFFVRPNLSNTRNEKDLFIEQLKEMKVSALAIHEYYNEVVGREVSAADKKKFLIQFRTLSLQISALKDLIEYSRTKQTGGHCEALFDAYLDYKKLITGSDFLNDNFKFDAKAYNKHTQAYNAVVTEIFHFIVDVNKLAH